VDSTRNWCDGREVARRAHVSLNPAVLLLTRRGARLVERRRHQVGDTLDGFIRRRSAADEKPPPASMSPREPVEEARRKVY